MERKCVQPSITLVEQEKWTDSNESQLNMNFDFDF